MARILRVTRITRKIVGVPDGNKCREAERDGKPESRGSEESEDSGSRRETSISGLLAQEIEALVSEDEAYERAQRQAMALLERGFHLGGVVRVTREELHER